MYFQRNPAVTFARDVRNWLNLLLAEPERLIRARLANRPCDLLNRMYLLNVETFARANKRYLVS